MAGQAFEAPRLQSFYLDPDEVVIIGLDTKDGPEHPLYDERIKLAVLDEHVQNVLKHGVLKPGLCIKEKLADGSTRTLVLDARQRVRWARAANKLLRETYDGAEYERRKVRVPFSLKQIVSDGEENGREKKQMSIMTAANVHRESDFVVKAHQAQRMLDMGMSMKAIALDFGVTEAAVGQWLRVLGLSDRMRAAVKVGTLTPSAAVQYSDLSHEEQDAIIDQAEKLGVKISTGEARNKRSQRKRGEGEKGKTVESRPVPRSVLKKLLGHESFMESLEEKERAFLAWICGSGADRKVKGLRAVLKEIGYIDDES